MVKLPEGYCIDSTEVTRAQYRAWLEANPSTAEQAASCRRNATFAPEASCMAAASCQSDCDRHPQVCVDWCDAYAYCRGVGKRLCGKIGGGPNPDGDYRWGDFEWSQWFNACSAHGMQKYASGLTYQAHDCNGPGHGAGKTVPVASMKTCPFS